MRKRWNLTQLDQTAADQLAASLGVRPLIAGLLMSRGYASSASARVFLNPSLDDLHEPFLLKDCEKAMNRIFAAIEGGEKILIWGDYDVDGTTGTVVLLKALELLGVKAGFHVPHRFTEGYGLNIPKMAEAKEKGYSLIISVDTGSRAFEPAEWAKNNGVDLIITDHHLADDNLGNPDAFAVVNPNQEGCSYPDKALAGVGVAFKLAHALLRAKGKERAIPSFLKVVALGTVADMMNLNGENRAIVSLGLQGLSNSRNFGLRALIDVAECTHEMTSMDIGFKIAPRINAAGRMDVARHVVELFQSQTPEDAQRLADILNSRNLERRQIQLEIADLAVREYVNSDLSESEKYVAVVAGKGWHRGVIGLASSRLSDKLYRPSLVISIDPDGLGHGSARSIANYHLLNGLESCADLFEKFGGHAAACGFTIREERIDELRTRINAHASTNISEDDLVPTIRIDATLPSADLGLDLVQDLKILEPFGQGHPKPRFLTTELHLISEPLIMKEKHLKLHLSDTEGRRFEAVWWEGVDKMDDTPAAGDLVDIVYSLEKNSWNGNSRLQLVVDDLRFS